MAVVNHPNPPYLDADGNAYWPDSEPEVEWEMEDLGSGACQRSIVLFGEDVRYFEACREMIGRLLRALKAFDDLRFHIGSFQSVEAYDDAGDCIDRIMLSLCGAVDVMARSLHFALQLSGSERNAKLHNTSWYKDNVRTIYANAAGITQVDAAQKSIETVFKLRNTIHNRALQASGATEPPASYVQLERGRMNLVVPSDIYQELGADERMAWGLRVIGQSPGGDGVVAADLATVTATALNRVFRFLDRLCWVISFEQVTDKAAVLKENIIHAASPVGPDNTAMVGRMLGLVSAAADDATDAPYRLPTQDAGQHTQPQPAAGVNAPETQPADQTQSDSTSGDQADASKKAGI
jgi:hypothetical protein